MIDLVPPDGQSEPALINEIDLAHAWWRFGGGRSEEGKWERLKLLRAIGERLIQQPSLAAFDADELDSKTIAELLRVESLREARAGATIAFWHDTLRDWTVGFLLHDKTDLLIALPTDRPLPGAFSRGLEIAARLALLGDATGARWLSLLARFEGAGCHGSWRRPILLALPRSENAFELLDRIEVALIANKGQRLKDIIRLMIAVESEPLAHVIARLQLSAPVANAIPAAIVMPTGTGWMPLVLWALTRVDRLPSALVPDLAKLFQLWLMATQAHVPQMNPAIVQKLYNWLTRIEEAMRPVAIRDVREAKEFDLDFGNLREVHDEIRMTFLAFCYLNSELAVRYLQETNTDWHHGAKDILRLSGSAAKAAPAALADFALAALIPKGDEDGIYSSRHNHFGPFDIVDSDFMPTSPGQGPFFELLENSPRDGLRLVRGVVEYATSWHRARCMAKGLIFPDMTIPFPDGQKSFDGSFGIYQWARGGTGALAVASALMALEAWAHRQIEGGRPVGEVLHNVLGPSGSSVAFVCVGVDVVLSHWEMAKDLAWPMLATPELLHFDHTRFTQDLSGMGRFFTPEQEPSNWPVKTADLLARPSRRHQLIDFIGQFTLNGPVEIHEKLREALEIACRRIGQTSYPDDNDPIIGLRATAARALRMTDVKNWPRKSLQLADGQEFEGHQYQLPPEEEALLDAARARANANITDLNFRLSVQKALTEPSSSTAEIVAQGIVWAKTRVAAGEMKPDDCDKNDDFDNQWRARVKVMAAALAARDYEGPDRANVEAWARPILHRAAAGETDDIAARAVSQIYSNAAAIAAIGYIGFYRRSQDTVTRDAVLALASRQGHAVLNAIGSHLSEFDRLDVRLARSLTRIVLKSAVHPRRTLEPAKDAAKMESYRRRSAEAMRDEMRWLDGVDPEPVWPDLAPWHSRRRRGFRIGHRTDAGERRRTPQRVHEEYVDEHVLGIWVGHLILLTVGDVAKWIVSLAHHLMRWTIAANNGPPGDEDEERENRPFHWNACYFDFLGILCVALPFERARALFMEPMTRLHNEAFYDAIGSLLRGFDRATLALDTKEPDNPRAVRALFADRLRRGRMVERLNDRVSFTAETHLADALTAMFYQPSRWENSVHIPERWSGLPDCMPVLTPLVVSAPNSGYLAVAFLTLVESYPCAALLPDVMQAASAWCKAHSAGAGFWNEHQIGHRICAWIDRVLSNDVEASAALGKLSDELGQCLDVLVRSGVASARALEARILDEGVHRGWPR